MLARLRNWMRADRREERSQAHPQPDEFSAPVCEPLENRRLYSATLAASFVGTLPQSFAPVSADHVKLRLTNTGNSVASGKATVSLYASADPSLDSSPELLASVNRQVLLRPRQSAPLALSFSLPSGLQGNDYLIAAVNAPATANSAGAQTITASAGTVSIPQPFVDLTGKVIAQPMGPLFVVASRSTSRNATVQVVNNGNIAARGSLDIVMYASTDNTLDTGDTQIASVQFNNISIRAGGQKAFTVHLLVPGSTPVGTYTLLASINPANTIAESNPANNIITAPQPLVLINPPVIVDQRDHHHNQDNSDNSDDGSEIDITDTGDDSGDDFDTGDGSDVSSPPPDTTAAPTSAPSDSGDSGDNSDSGGSDFGGDSGDDSGGGADF